MIDEGYSHCHACSLSPSNAVNIVGIAVGVSIAGLVVFLVIPIAICVIIWCCVAGAASQSRRAGRTSYVATAAPTTTATVVSTTAAAYPAGGHNYPNQVYVCVYALYLIAKYYTSNHI